MTFADDEEFAAFIGRDHLLKAITPEAICSILGDFPYQIVAGRDAAWLATAVRRALGITLQNVSDSPDRMSNSDIRGDLLRLSKLASDTWLQMFTCDSALDSRIWDVAWRRWDGEGGRVSEPAEYRRFKSAILELEWLASFLRTVANETPVVKGPWRDSERKVLRIRRAHFLAPIYEAAFGRKVTANNYGSGDDRHSKPSPFMLFYERITLLAFGRAETCNLSEVTKAACRLHKNSPVQFSEGVIPGL